MDLKDLDFDALRFDDPDETEQRSGFAPETHKSEYASAEAPAREPITAAAPEQPAEPQPSFQQEPAYVFPQEPEPFYQPEPAPAVQPEPASDVQPEHAPVFQNEADPSFSQEPALTGQQEPEPVYFQEPEQPLRQEPEYRQEPANAERPYYPYVQEMPQAQESYYQQSPAPSAEYQAAAPLQAPAYPPTPDPRNYNNDYADPADAWADMPELPPSGFEVLFGESKLLAFLSLLSGVTGISWLILYLAMLLERSSMFTQAIEAMSLQGQYDYSVTFTSPFLGVLRAVLYLVPVLSLIWSAAVAVASKKNKKLGKKAVLIAVLAVFAVVGIVAVFDVCAAGLVFDIVKT